MRRNDASRTTKAFEKAATARRAAKCVVKLYVAGATERSQRAVLRARQLCETEFGDDFELQVIDVYQRPILARDGQIIATPTLVREFPRPVRRLIGDLSTLAGRFVGLDFAAAGKSAR
jgi:circadian clock protein KaiB